MRRLNQALDKSWYENSPKEKKFEKNWKSASTWKLMTKNKAKNTRNNRTLEITNMVTRSVNQYR